MERGMTLKEVQTYTKNFLQSEYGLDCIVPIKFNGRLTRTIGLFRSIGNLPISLEFSAKHFEFQKSDVLIDVIKHECIHYALCVLDKPFNDGHPVFEAELRKHNSSSTGALKSLRHNALNVEQLPTK